MGKKRAEHGGVWMVGEWGKYGRSWKYVGVWGEVREGVKRCVTVLGVWGGVGNVLGCGEVWGMGSRCVEVCSGCGERCGKGVRMGATRGEVGEWGVGEWKCV